MRRIHVLWMLTLACQGGLSFNGKPVTLGGSNPPPPAAAAAPAAPAPAAPAPAPTATASPAPEVPPPLPEPAAASSREAPAGRAAPVAEAAPRPFEKKPMPSDDELYRFGMGCRAGKAAACRELALIYMPEKDDAMCGSYTTDDPNGPIAKAVQSKGRHGLAAGKKDKAACTPPEYRHGGACGNCEMPRISCGHSEHGVDFEQGTPFGHASDKCPAGEWCSMHGVCFAKSEFPVENRNLSRGSGCYLDRECASGKCVKDGATAFGRHGSCN